MIWTPQQDAALKSVAAWLKCGEPQLFRLFGYAGTGKTTLAKKIAEDVDGSVAFAAFTGKAALVMRSKGCGDARTIHSLIYRARETDTEEPSFVLNEDSAVTKSRLVIVAGATARTKVVEVSGDPAIVSVTLAAWLAELPQA